MRYISSRLQCQTGMLVMSYNKISGVRFQSAVEIGVKGVRYEE